MYFIHYAVCGVGIPVTINTHKWLSGLYSFYKKEIEKLEIGKSACLFLEDVVKVEKVSAGINS